VATNPQKASILKSFSLIVARTEGSNGLLSYHATHREGWVTFQTDPRSVEQMKARVPALKNAKFNEILRKVRQQTGRMVGKAQA